MPNCIKCLDISTCKICVDGFYLAYTKDGCLSECSED